MSAVSTLPTARSFFAASLAAGAIGICVLAAVVWGQAPSAEGEKAVARPGSVAATAAPTQAKAPAATVNFSADGKLRQPVGYRKWVHLGTPLTPKELNDDEVSEFHAVYMDPESFDHYEKTGELRDGTVMIKEFVGVGSKEAVSGKGYFMGEFTGLEVSIKDSKRFKDEPGNWAYFNFGTYPLKADVSNEAVDSCNSCHQDNAKTDWVFSQYYPVLRAATPRTK